MTATGRLANGIERRLDELARRMVGAFVNELPVYAHLPAEQLEGEIADICRRNLSAFAAHLRADGEPPAELLAEVRASATRRADEGVPLDAVLAAYHLGARITWEAVREQAPDPGVVDLAAGRLLSFLTSVSQVAAAAFVEERESITSDQRDAMRALAESLLAGDPHAAMSDRAGLPVAAAYAVLAVEIGPTADELDDTVTTSVAARRKLRRAEGAFAGLAPGVLQLLGPAGGTVLVPAAPGPGGDPTAEMVARAGAVVAATAAATGATIHAGVAWRPDRAALPAASDEAAAVVTVVRRLGRPPGAYRADDVLFELAVSGEMAVADRLADLLAPLAGGPDLVETLEGWIEADGNRRAAAAALFVHPNTLDYRLGRIAALTGLSPTTARGSALLQAALAATHLRH